MLKQQAAIQRELKYLQDKDREREAALAAKRTASRLGVGFDGKNYASYDWTVTVNGGADTSESQYNATMNLNLNGCDDEGEPITAPGEALMLSKTRPPAYDCTYSYNENELLDPQHLLDHELLDLDEE